MTNTNRTTPMSKSRSVLQRASIIEGISIVFGPDEGVERPVVVLAPQMYEDFGEPDEITVTIEPGDKLNDEVSA